MEAYLEKTFDESLKVMLDLEQKIISEGPARFSLQTSQVVSAFLMGRGHRVHNMRQDSGKVMVGVIPQDGVAKVGDVVQSKRDGPIQFAVGYVGEEYVFSDPMKRVGTWMLEHGDYVIVRSGAEATQEQP
jgi:hypothetical protein